MSNSTTATASRKRPLVGYADSDSEADSDSDSGACAQAETGESRNDDDLATKSSRKRRFRDDADANSFSEGFHRQSAPQAAPPTTPPPPPPPPHWIDMVRKAGPNDDPGSHQGRVRRIPHIDGNFAVHVFVSVALDERLDDLIRQMIAVASECLGADFHPICSQERTSANTSGFCDVLDQGLHLSLSHVGFIKVFQIERFLQALKSRLYLQKRFTIKFGSLECYVNEDKSRSFLGLEISQGKEEMKRILGDVDAVMVDYHLRTFFKEPRFHASVAWSLTTMDPHAQVWEKVQQQFLPQIASLHLNRILWVECRIGQKMHRFPLG